MMGASKHNHRDDDRYKHLSIDVTSDQQKADLDFKNHNESYKIFFTNTKGDNLYLQYGILYVCTMVRCIPVTFVTLNDGEGGRKILGLSTAWTVYQRAVKVIEFDRNA